MRNKKQKRNSPIATLIKNYVNKNSGKVSASREEIQRRFNWLEWKDQKKILTAFLDSGRSDREWAYGKVLDYWDESFMPKVKALWETYHEYKCSWSVIRYFPIDYILEHIEDFTDERDYFFICLRLAKDKSFVIDRAKLSNTDYLAVLYHTDRYITADDARDTIFTIVHDCCLNDTFIMKLERLDSGKHRDVITPANFREVNLAFYYVVKLQQYEVAAQFRDWNEAVEEAIYNSPEFKAIEKKDFSFDFEYDQRRIAVAKLYAIQALDEKYKQPSDPSVEVMRDAYEKSVEWSRMYHERAAEVLSPSILDFWRVDSDEDESLPF